VPVVQPSTDLAEHVAALVQHRRTHHDDVVALCELVGLDQEILDSVERNGMHAPLAHIHAYANAMGLDTSLRVKPKALGPKQFESCKQCGSHPTFHTQRHLVAVNACVDVNIAMLVEALFNLSIHTTMSCEGGAGEDAHLVFSTLEDVRAFFSIVDRGDEALRLRAGLRPFHASDLGKQKLKTWEHSIRWHVQPGDLLADAVSWVRFSPGELKGLTRLMQAPPGPSALAMMSRRQLS
jgi:hypothetical protein